MGIVKSLAVSKLFCIAYVLSVPTGIVYQVKKTILNSIWNHKPPKIKGNSTMIREIEDGGLHMPDFEIINNFSKVGWGRLILQLERHFSDETCNTF